MIIKQLSPLKRTLIDIGVAVGLSALLMANLNIGFWQALLILVTVDLYLTARSITRMFSEGDHAFATKHGDNND